jgi:penicillin-insensitive murein endopeptidase
MFAHDFREFSPQMLTSNQVLERIGLPRFANHARYRCFWRCALIALLTLVESAQARDWSSVSVPTRGAPRVIGRTTSGCIAGAVSLPTDGTGYSVVRLSRNRYYGHPSLIRFVQGLGQAVSDRRLGILQIGDLAQPRGGPMAYGHQSHQTGLDVDIWFNVLNGRLPGSKVDPWRDQIRTPSLLNDPGTGLDHRLWNHSHVEILEQAARFPAVDRIFVNAVIKRELCRSVRGNRAWLEKIRPWYGHDDHFHVRLHCPDDSPACVRQAEVPAGDGCGGDLQWWLKQRPMRPPARPAHPPRPVLPQACYALLQD